MAIYHQGDKVKEVWHQGRKVKEIWHMGRKVYSSRKMQVTVGYRGSWGIAAATGDVGLISTTTNNGAKIVFTKDVTCNRHVGYQYSITAGTVIRAGTEVACSLNATYTFTEV